MKNATAHARRMSHVGLPSQYAHPAHTPPILPSASIRFNFRNINTSPMISLILTTKQHKYDYKKYSSQSYFVIYMQNKLTTDTSMYFNRYQY